MNAGFVKRKLFNSVQPKETSIQEQSQTICLDLRLFPCMLVSLGWTELKSFRFTNPVFIHFSFSKVPKSGPYFKKVKKAHVHLIRLTCCVILFVAEKLWKPGLATPQWQANNKCYISKQNPDALNVGGVRSKPAIWQVSSIPPQHLVHPGIFADITHIFCLRLRGRQIMFPELFGNKKIKQHVSPIRWRYHLWTFSK